MRYIIIEDERLAYNNFASEAFRRNGIDYLQKPISETDLAAALVKLEQRLVPRPGRRPSNAWATSTGSATSGSSFS